MAPKKTDVPEPEPPEVAQVWAVIVEGKTMPIFHLPIDDIDDIAKRHNIPWMLVIDRPLQDLKVCQELVLLAAKKLGVAMPLLPSVKSLYDLLELVPDDLPTSFVDGIPKSGAVEDDPETTG